MTDNQNKLNQLFNNLENLLKRQEEFSKEISKLQTEIVKLKSPKAEETDIEEKIIKETVVPEKYIEVEEKDEQTTIHQTYQQKFPKRTSTYSAPKAPKVSKRPKIKSNLEKFIGENLINKIGIAITVIGVSIGAKYAIDHQLISPLTRIILGYLFGIGLLGVAIRLKKNYDNFSAVLLSGAMAIMYFITYAAYSFYDLFPQIIAFILMLVFTAFTVLAALKYNRQVIAHIGLVGAYAVPFLLSENSGRVDILFSYTAIINIGILVIAFKKYWKPLYYSSFILTWMIYFFWFESEFQIEEHIGLAFTFLTIFFTIFYLTFLVYKLIKKEKFEFIDILLLLANSFIFFGVGYDILNNYETGEQLLGIFTICNAIIHFIVSVIIYKQKLADRNLFYLISGLVLVFITIAIPIQLNGNWVTLLWAGEAALLFWIGRTKNVPIYEMISYAIMILAFFSIYQDWLTVYSGYDPDFPETRITPILNINFLVSTLFIAAFGFINILNNNKKYNSPLISQHGILRLVSYLIPAILVFVLYYSFIMEISNYWGQLIDDSAITFTNEGESYQNYYRDVDLNRFKNIWLINYSLLFFSILSFVNIKKLKSQQLGFVNLAINTLTITAFLLFGLYELSELRESYLQQSLSQYYNRGIFNLVIRYISFVFVAIMLIACYRYTRKDFMKNKFHQGYDLLFHATLLWIISSELLNWMDIANSDQTYKLGLSILWGVYSLMLIALGIWKKKKYLRIWALSLFAATLLKLFFYDITHLNTIAKTIVFVSLGILLLIISFLYNKYKNLISDEVEN